MVRALRSHGRCWLVVSSRRTRTSSVTDRRLITDLSTALYDQKDLCVLCRTYTSVESLATKPTGPLKRPSPSTVASLHDITSSFTSCCESHRLQTRLRLLKNVFFYQHDFNMSFKVFPLLSRIFLLAVVPWRHHLVMILDSIHSKTVFAMLASAWGQL